MYRVYVKDSDGKIYAVEENISREEVQSKMDYYLEQGYEEAMVLNDYNYVMGKVKEKCKVLKRELTKRKK